MRWKSRISADLYCFASFSINRLYIFCLCFYLCCCHSTSISFPHIFIYRHAQSIQWISGIFIVAMLITICYRWIQPRSHSIDICQLPTQSVKRQFMSSFCKLHYTHFAEQFGSWHAPQVRDKSTRFKKYLNVENLLNFANIRFSPTFQGKTQGMRSILVLYLHRYN